jgi:MFS family permease
LRNFRTSTQVVLACTVGNAVGITPMVYTVFGLFLLPISGEFHWPRSAVSIVLLIVAVAGAIGYPIVGRTIDRYGDRVVVLSGIVAFAVAVSLVALINANRLELYAAYALIGITGTIPSSVTFTKQLARLARRLCRFGGRDSLYRAAGSVPAAARSTVRYSRERTARRLSR